MKRARLFLLLCCGWLATAQAQITLNGNLLTDAEKPVPATRVGVTGGPGNITDAKGQFSIKLSLDFIEGERVLLVVDKKNWVINHPLDGEWNLPAKKLQEVPTQYTKVIIVPLGSKALWTHARIEKHIALLSDEIAKLKKEGDTPKRIDFSYYLSEWANKYDFTPEQVTAAFDKWAKEVENSKDFRTLGLRAFYEKSFAEAAENFEKAAKQGAARLKALQEETRQVTLKTYMNWKDAGNALSNLYRFTEALAKYDSASSLVSKTDYPGEWAVIRIFTGNTKKDIGIRTEGGKAIIFLRESEHAYREAFEVYTREQLPLQWATTQNNLGIALQEQGTRASGEDGAQLLSQAVEAFRAALTVYTREQFPQDWAMVQNNMGVILNNLGIRADGEKGAQLFSQAVEAYRQALTVYTSQYSRQLWAVTQNNLGTALYEQGIRTVGEKGSQLLKQAIEACRQALIVYTREDFEQQWAMSQNNLGNALLELGIRTGGEAGAKLFAEAVEAYRQALTVYVREQLPQDWAMTQNNLGTALKNQAAGTNNEESDRLLAEAAEAYRAALLVYTREQLPQQWALTQTNWGAALYERSLRIRGEKGDKLLVEAVEAYRQALTVYTHEHLPQQWALTQSNLGAALCEQGLRTGEEAGARLLTQSIDAFNDALLEYSIESLPIDWARTQYNLGRAFYNLGILTGGEKGLEQFKKAVKAYREVLRVLSPSSYPERWTYTQKVLAEIYSKLKDLANVAECNANVLQVFPDDETAYKTASRLYQKTLFSFSAAYSINQQWLEHHPDDLSAQCDFAEKHFTTGRFVECEHRLTTLLVNSETGQNSKIALRAIQMANSLALGQTKQIPANLESLQQTIASQPDTFKVSWTFEGTKHFISQNEKLAPYREWLLQLFAAMEIEDGREAMIAALREVQNKFNEAK